jgi:hypothetical protein
MSEKKMVSRNVAVALGIICVILAAGYGVVIEHFMSIVSDRDRTIGSLNNQVAGLISDTANLTSTLSSLTTEVSALNSSIMSLQGKIESSSPSSLVLYGTYNVSWGQNNPESYNLISGGGELSVAGYSSLSVFLQFENVVAEDEEWNAMWTVLAYWYLDASGTLVAFGYLPFTVSVVTPGTGVEPIGVYSIKAPYVSLSPTLVNVYDCGLSNQFSPAASVNATAVCKIYVYLSQDQGTPSDQAMNDQQIGMIHDAATATTMAFGPYLIEGYSQIYIQMVSNVSCSVTVDDMLYPAVIYDSFSLVAGFMIQRNYEVQSQQIRLEFSVVTPMPWEVYIRVYLKP